MISSSHDQMHAYNMARPIAVERRWRPNVEIAPNCPRCDSSNTKFCYYNNYSLTQPRYFCKGCRRYWTKGGSLRNVPVGGGCRKNRRGKSVRLSSSQPIASTSSVNYGRRPSSDYLRPDLALDDMVGSSHQVIGSGSVSSVDLSGSVSDGSKIDLAMLYAKFLNQCPVMEQGLVMPELAGGVGKYSFDLISGSSSSDGQLGQSDGNTGLLGDLDYSFDPSGYESLPIPAAGVDIFPTNSPIFPNLAWQAPELHQRGFCPVPEVDMSHHQDVMSCDWSSLDQSSFGAF